MKNIVVTTSWDDGSALDLRLADRLAAHGLAGTFYIPRKYLSQSLSETQIAGLDKGFEIGAHTISHVDLVKAPEKMAGEEITASKQWLEQLLGHPVEMFCYPRGKYNGHIKNMVSAAGFLAARTVECRYLKKHFGRFDWPVTLQASNGSPLQIARTWLKTGIAARSLRDWDIRASLLFDLVVATGGVYHLWGHSWEIDCHDDWARLEKVLKYISGRAGVRYLANSRCVDGPPVPAPNLA